MADFSPKELRPTSSGISHQMLLVLEGLITAANKREEFQKICLDLQRQQIEEIEHHFESEEALLDSLPKLSRCDPDTAMLKEFLKAGAKFEGVPFVAAAGGAYWVRELENMVRESRFAFPGTFSVLIIPDEDGILEAGECIFHYRESTGGDIYHEGPILAARAPTNLDTDVQKFLCVGEVELFRRCREKLGSWLSYKHLNVLVLSTKAVDTGGESRRWRAPADLLSGGDYDGDRVTIITFREVVDLLPTTPKRNEHVERLEAKFKGPSSAVVPSKKRALRRQPSAVLDPVNATTGAGAPPPPSRPLVDNLIAEIKTALDAQSKVASWTFDWVCFADLFGTSGDFSAIPSYFGWCSQEAIDLRLKSDWEKAILSEFEGKMHDPQIQQMIAVRDAAARNGQSCSPNFGSAEQTIAIRTVERVQQRMRTTRSGGSAGRVTRWIMQVPDWYKPVPKRGGGGRTTGGEDESPRAKSTTVLGKLLRQRKAYVGKAFTRRVMNKFCHQFRGAAKLSFENSLVEEEANDLLGDLSALLERLALDEDEDSGAGDVDMAPLTTSSPQPGVNFPFAGVASGGGSTSGVPPEPATPFGSSNKASRRSQFAKDPPPDPASKKPKLGAPSRPSVFAKQAPPVVGATIAGFGGAAPASRARPPCGQPQPRDNFMDVSASASTMVRTNSDMSVMTTGTRHFLVSGRSWMVLVTRHSGGTSLSVCPQRVRRGYIEVYPLDRRLVERDGHEYCMIVSRGRAKFIFCSVPRHSRFRLCRLPRDHFPAGGNGNSVAVFSAIAGAESSCDRRGKYWHHHSGARGDLYAFYSPRIPRCGVIVWPGFSGQIGRRSGTRYLAPQSFGKRLEESTTGSAARAEFLICVFEEKI